ncbi:4858_t:CDS:2 [Racocetra fulgida]|uniref:4858_t:CDS:1 n=1 Tax=Racocetra fulgida TaxID=60492 RepID=A0A9N8WDC7_9GLOM|nr:4858_t:CDS:2 [Racocetra fulgida]
MSFNSFNSDPSIDFGIHSYYREYRAEHERLIKIGRGGDPEQSSKPYYADRGSGVSSGPSSATHGQYGTVP